MQKIFQLAQNLQNLNRIKRSGGNLVMGLPTYMNISIAEHSYMVSYLTMLFADKLQDPSVDFAKIMRYVITHDWHKIILGDIPSGSPSFATFWDINVRQESGKAEDKATSEMLDSIKEEVDISLYKSDLNDLEKQIVRAADWIAYLLEMQEWKYLGYQHEGWEMVWFNTLAIVEKINLSFIPQLLSEIKLAYKKGTKPCSPWLAKQSAQLNPEHKL